MTKASLRSDDYKFQIADPKSEINDLKLEIRKTITESRKREPEKLLLRFDARSKFYGQA